MVMIMVIDGNGWYNIILPSNLHQRPLPHNDHFSTTATFLEDNPHLYIYACLNLSTMGLLYKDHFLLSRQGGHCGQVQPCILCSWSIIANENCNVILLLRSLLTNNPPSPGKVGHTTRVDVPYSFRTVAWVLFNYVPQEPDKN